jgi:hypothetical protein
MGPCWMRESDSHDQRHLYPGRNETLAEAGPLLALKQLLLAALVETKSRKAGAEQREGGWLWN